MRRKRQYRPLLHQAPESNPDVEVFLAELEERLKDAIDWSSADPSSDDDRNATFTAIARNGQLPASWLAEHRLDQLLRFHEVSRGVEIAAEAERSLIDAVNALVVRAEIPLNDAKSIYGFGSTILPPESFQGDPHLQELLARCPRPLTAILNWLREEVGPTSYRILLMRTGSTLQSIGEELGMTREGIRQHEKRAVRHAVAITKEIAPELWMWWRDRLESMAVSEEMLFGSVGVQVSPQSDELLLGRALVREIGAARPHELATRSISGWLTSKPALITEMLTGLSSMLPCRQSDIDDAISDLSISEAGAVEAAIRSGACGFRYHAAAGVWVGAGAQDRDAAYVLIHESGQPLEPASLAERLEMKERALNEALRRDDRFVLKRPQGLWSLAEWTVPEQHKYETTLDVCVSVLQDLGPMRLSDLTRAVQARYPITPAAVAQCIYHPVMGRWPDGRIDLAERGAPRLTRSAARQSRDVERLAEGVIQFMRTVDADVLRGSGIGVPPMLTWDLGLRTHGSSRTFDVRGLGKLVIRYTIHGSTVSSLRGFAEALEARSGCRLQITLNEHTDQAEVALCCTHHDHPAVA